MPAHTRPFGGLRLQKLFSRRQPCSSCGLLSSRFRASDKSILGRTLPTDSRTVMARLAPALDLRPEQLQAHMSGKQLHQSEFSARHSVVLVAVTSRGYVTCNRRCVVRFTLGHEKPPSVSDATLGLARRQHSFLPELRKCHQKPIHVVYRPTQPSTLFPKNHILSVRRIPPTWEQL